MRGQPQIADLIIRNASQLATPVTSADFFPADFLTIGDSAVACHKGRIVAVGKTSEVLESVLPEEDAVLFDASQKTITPGFVDCHTHLVFDGTRDEEFEMRNLGRSYEEIAARGGGIRATMRNVRKASKDELITSACVRLDRCLANGTTTIEAKSGYGLSVVDELRILEVISELNRRHPVEIIATFLGAHEFPDEYRDDRRGYIQLVLNEMLTEVKGRHLAEYCDVFCESNVFTVDESREILSGARNMGFKLKIHSEQLAHTGGTALAAELGAVSADHLDYTNESDWSKMREARVIPVVLPGAVYFLGKKHYANAKAMWNMGLPVATATDLNPGSCMTESIPAILNIMCVMMGMTAAQALTAATYHAAQAIDRGNFLGTLEVGKAADLVVWDAPSYKHIPYHFGVNLINTVIKSGKIVHRCA